MHVSGRTLSSQIAWADDVIGSNPRRLLRRIDELVRRNALDGIIGDEWVDRVYRLSERFVRKFPDSADSGGVTFDGNLQLYIDRKAGGNPPYGFN